MTISLNFYTYSENCTVQLWLGQQQIYEPSSSDWATNQWLTDDNYTKSTSEGNISQHHHLLGVTSESSYFIAFHPSVNVSCTYWFHVVAVHQWVVSCAWAWMSTVHHFVRFSATQSTLLSSSVCVSTRVYVQSTCTPSANRHCCSCSYPHTTYANQGWTIAGSREGWPRVGAIIVLQNRGFVQSNISNQFVFCLFCKSFVLNFDVMTVGLSVWWQKDRENW